MAVVRPRTRDVEGVEDGGRLLDLVEQITAYACAGSPRGPPPPLLVPTYPGARFVIRRDRIFSMYSTCRVAPSRPRRQQTREGSRELRFSDAAARGRRNDPMGRRGSSARQTGAPHGAGCTSRPPLMPHVWRICVPPSLRARDLLTIRDTESPSTGDDLRTSSSSTLLLKGGPSNAPPS